MNGIGSTLAQTAKPMSEIESIMRSIDSEIELTLSQLESLHLRISGLLSPQLPTEKLSAVQGSSASSMFGSLLENHLRLIRQTNNSIADLLARIQL